MDESATNLKNRFGDYLEKARSGEAIFVHKHGKPVAVLLDYSEWKQLHSRDKKAQSSWVQSCKKLSDEILKSGKPQTSAVKLIRQLREETS